MSNEEVEEMWLKLKDMKRIPSDGIFYCRNVDGRKVVVLYNEAMGICMTCDTNDCDLGNPENFEERH